MSHVESDKDQTWANKTARDLLWSDPGVMKPLAPAVCMLCVDAVTALSCDMGFTLHPVRGEGVFKVGEDKVSEFLKVRLAHVI